MSRLHILQQGGNNVYSVVVHAPTPVGNNSAGISWATAIQNAGPPVSVLPVGNGPGQITQAESNSVANGSVIEAPFQWGDDLSFTAQQRQDDLSLRAQQAVTAAVEDLQHRLKFFGLTVT